MAGAGEDGVVIAGDEVVLLVEDEPAIREVIQLVLEELLGVSVVVAEDGLEALGKVAAVRPSLVVTDVQMPRLSGVELIRLLRRRADCEAIPVVAISASRTCLADARQAGADDAVVKPFDLDYLMERVAKHLRGAPVGVAV